MGTLAVQASAKNIETLLITSDLDMLQLVNERVHVYALKTGLSNIELYSPKSFEAKYGIAVKQFLDFKALKGDSSDNIPGVPGIGEKTALELLQQYHTLDGVYDNLDLIKESTRRKLAAGKDLAELSKKLAAIWTDAPLTLNLAAIDGSTCRPEKVMELLQKLEFRSLVRQLPEVMQVAIDKQHTSSGAAPLKPGKNVLIDTNKKLAELTLPDSEYLYVHSRSAGKHGRNPRVLALSTDGQIVYTIDLTKVDKKQLARQWPKTSPLVGYDLKSTLKLLIELGITNLPSIGHDVLIGAFLINSLRREQTLTELATADLHYEGAGFEELNAEQLMSEMPEIMAIIKRLHEQQAKAIRGIPKLAQLAKEVEWPVIPVLARMEHAGIQLDTSYLKKVLGRD